ncbi:MAG: hypothetical protein NTW06_02240, partial [Candidatus Falkowbacteria bacterium]|nr:hypothetical protein [Candidatus Falkowbacteria bacterium]
GFTIMRSQLIATNNAVFNISNLNSEFGGTGGVFTLNYNATDDNTGAGTNWINISPNVNGATDAQDWAKAFTDYANNDFSIKNYFSPLFDAGTTITSVTSDIIGTPRPKNTAYDIGAFEFYNTIPQYRIENKIQIEGKVQFE